MWRHNGSKWWQQFYINLKSLILLVVVAASSVLISSVQTTILLEDTCPKLTVQRVHQQAQKHEISLILYHVSWSNNSQTALAVYEQLVEKYTKHIYFATIDCFITVCNCSGIYEDLNGKLMSPYRWPTLIAHYDKQHMVRYTGEWNYDSMSRFLERLLQPIQRVSNHGELRKLLMTHDTVILALLPNLNNNLAHYMEFVHVAYHFMEFDAEQAYIFAIVLGENVTNDAANVLLTPKMYMYTEHTTQPQQQQNKIEEFKGNDWQRNRIIIWLQASFKQQFSNLYAYNSPKTLALNVRKQPVLCILVPTNRSNYFNIINQNIPTTYPTTTTTTTKLLLDVTDIFFVLKNKHNNGNCQKLPLKASALFYNNYQQKQLYNYLSGRVGEIQMQRQRDFETFNIMYEKSKRSKQQHAVNNVRIVIAKYIKKSIDLVKLKLKLHHASTIVYNYNSNINNNNTLTVMLIDVDKHHDMLAQHDIKLTADMLALAFIADFQHESIFVMLQNYSFQALLQFVHDYYDKNLIRHKKTSISILQEKQQQRKQEENNTEYIDYVRDINGTMLLELLKQKSNKHNKNVTIVLLMYASNCALCAVILQPLLQLSAMLHNNDDHDDAADNNKSGGTNLQQQLNIKFVRINTQFNILPWELDVPRTPAIFVFPHHLNGDSRLFPNHLEADWRNIFAFILAQLEPIEQMHLILRVCNRNMMASMRLQNCLKFGQRLVVKHIGHYLKYWQMHDHERPQLLDRLNQFKNFYMIITQKLRIQQ